MLHSVQDPIEWSRKFLAGDSVLFTQIYQDHKHIIYLYALTFLDHTGKAEDVVAYAFTELWRYREKITDSHSVRPFLFAVVRNACIREKRVSRIQTFLEEGSSVAEISEAEQPSQRERLIIEMTRLIYSQAEKLPQRQREVFFLYFVKRKKGPEIAELLHLRRSTVYNILRQIIRSLQAFIRETGLEKITHLSLIYLIINFCR